MFNRLVYFLDKHNVLDYNQFGFRSGRSTTQGLLCLSLIKSKEPLKTKYTPAGYFWT